MQGIELLHHQLNTHRVTGDLDVLRTDRHFNGATFLYPVRRPDDVYTLHTYFSRVSDRICGVGGGGGFFPHGWFDFRVLPHSSHQLHLEALKSQSVRLAQRAGRISNGTLSNAVLEVRWPLGVAPAVRPETRHDLQPWQVLNETHMLMPDHERNVAPLAAVDADDLRVSINGVFGVLFIPQPEV